MVLAMTNWVYIATSLDGFIATLDGGLDWLFALPNPENDDYGYGDFIAQMDAIVMGRNTFETVLGFDEWPYTKPVIVLSHQLKTVPDRVRGQAEIMAGDVVQIERQLNQRGYTNLYIDGGNVIQHFLQSDRIDHLVLSRIPIILGQGIPLFKTLDLSLSFNHVATTTYPSGLVKSHYVRDRAE